MSKAIIVYYSHSGDTKKIAEYISARLNIDILEIKPEKEVSSGFMKYVFGGRQAISGESVKLLPIDIDFEKYDTVIIGSAVWAGRLTPPIKTLLESGKIKGKNIACFYCHRGGEGKVVERTKDLINKENEFVSSIGCMNVNGNLESVTKEVLEWIRDII